MNLKELAGLLNVEAKGAHDYPIKGVRDIERLDYDDLLEEHYVYFIESAAVLKRHPKAAEQGVILTIPKLAERFKQTLVAPESDVRLALIALLQRFDKRPAFTPGVSQAPRIHPSAKIDAGASVLPGAVVMEGAVVGAGCTLYPGVVLEPFSAVGEGTILYPNVVIGHHCLIGTDCIIHAGAVIGADGFGFYDRQGRRHKIPQIGNVEIADFVEIGAGCTIDRATIESTRIGANTKFDDQVHVGHNVQIGRFVYIVANSAFGGSVVVEDGAMISGNVIVKDHVKIGKGAVIMGMSGVTQDAEAGVAYFGTPARPARQMHKMNAALERLPELLIKVRRLEDKVLGPLPAA